MLLEKAPEPGWLVRSQKYEHTGYQHVPSDFRPSASNQIAYLLGFVTDFTLPEYGTTVGLCQVGREPSGSLWRGVMKIRVKVEVRENGGWRTEMKRSNNSHRTSAGMLCEHSDSQENEQLGLKEKGNRWEICMRNNSEKIILSHSIW